MEIFPADEPTNSVVSPAERQKICFVEDLHMAHVAVGVVLVTVWGAALVAGLLMLGLERCFPRLLQTLLPGETGDSLFGGRAAPETRPDRSGPTATGEPTAG